MQGKMKEKKTKEITLYSKCHFGPWYDSNVMPRTVYTRTNQVCIMVFLMSSLVPRVVHCYIISTESIHLESVVVFYRAQLGLKG